MMKESDLLRYENFLKNIDISKYSQLKKIKTVEQDLPKDLLPLDLYYKYYWIEKDFLDYDKIFSIYWYEKLNPHIYNFIKKYFYGCSMQFVEEGFKARLYRIWMSILTQFHFQYLWNSLFEEKLISTPELDLMGIDSLVELNNKKVAIQIKKISYRREVSNRRFTKRQQKYADVIVEVPYLVINTEELEHKLNSSRVKPKNKEKYRNLLHIFNNNFIQLNNGFVIFREEYLRKIRDIILTQLKDKNIISYEEILNLM